jgi:hypothetical protein
MFSQFLKKRLLFIVPIVIILSSTQCTNKLKVNSSDLLKPYSDEQVALIQDHWKQYFKEDIFAALDSGQTTFPIAFDSYGGIYPNFILFQDFDEDNFAAGLPGKVGKIKNIATIKHSDNDLNKYSMFQIFQWEGNADKLEAGIAAIKNTEDQNFYKNLLLQYSLAPGYQGKNIKKSTPAFYEYLNGFYAKWNAYHLNKTNQNLIKLIDEEEPDYLLFFIHGYNVPYGLAAMQSIEIRDYIENIQEQINKPGKLLMVPIFWSSNDQKKSEFDTEEKVKMGDEVKVSNAIKWGFYSTRANFAGLGLRQVLNRLETSKSDLPELLMFSHSLGAIVATNAIINATSRLPGKYTSQIINDNCVGISMADSTKIALEKKEIVNYELIQKFNAIPLPKSRIRVFMSSPAISGIETFKDMCEEEKKTTAFFSTVNHKDLTLKKFVGIVNGFGCTSLGLNNNCDVMQTKIDYFWDQGYFYYNKVAIEIPQHNLFDYLQQPAYRALVEDFLKFEFPVQQN